MKTMHFQLLAGTHRGLDGAIYKPGDIVQTGHDLVKTFGSESFRRLSDGEVAVLTNAETPDAEERPTKKTKKTKKARA